MGGYLVKQSVFNMNAMMTEIFAASTNNITYELYHLTVKWILRDYKL